MQTKGWSRRRVAAVMAVVSLVVVAGCGTGGPADGPTTGPTTVESSPTPTPAPTSDLTRLPEPPAAMSEPTTDGAIAAATYVLDLYGYTFATGDTGPWRQMTRESCELCVGLARDVEQMVEVDDSSTGALITVDTAEAREISDDRWFGVDMEITQSSSTRFDADGEVVGSDPGGRYKAAFALSWDEGWHVDDLGFEALESDAGNEG
ncbi:DUF6318 family protein [Cellulomonas phragmiteti]|uniref:DUF6318 domain-containing protein n=1 Tax=Cellulomonas phragmiteti TaxID=478780 RepID=A0ABQ4DMS6_9CELL|nr:DUF6318 family protein [Cellulomonas phragmiteti]GIG40649.1 hypothetical protein Cph01nite_24110 [Cellulomonas phragmiteti]